MADPQEKELEELENLSDEEFMEKAFARDTSSMASAEEPAPEDPGGLLEDRLSAPPEAAEEETTEPEEEPEASSEAEQPDETAEPVSADANAEEEATEEKTEEETEEPAQATQEEEETSPAEAASDDESHTTSQQTKEDEEAVESVDYEQLYKQVMAPFKANGREFAPESPEEAIRLMQMGANYTKKMQALKPNLKLMRMLENNGLLDEEKISFLIDLDKKNPAAVQKLLKDGKIDPLEIDTSSESTYKPGNHTVSDEEMAFQDVITDVGSTDTGKETIHHINNTWDQASKQVIYQEPQVLAIINEQRANGIYDIISAEIDRQRTLGNLTNVPFIQAYKEVGDRLHAAGKLGPANTSQQENPATTNVNPPPQNQVLESRVERRTKPISNGAKAKAASAAPKAPKTQRRDFDPFSMSDEEIMAITEPKI